MGMLDKMNPFKKKSEKSELDRVLDEGFKNAGPLGALAKPLIKGVASMVGDAMKETAADMDTLTDQTVRAIRMNSQASDLLGSSIACGAPFSTMSSSSNINGVATKNMQLQVRLAYLCFVPW